ncbi:MAG: hypothetical protein ACK559_23425, partial [bacterium]
KCPERARKACNSEITNEAAGNGDLEDEAIESQPILGLRHPVAPSNPRQHQRAQDHQPPVLYERGGLHQDHRGRWKFALCCQDWFHDARQHEDNQDDDADGDEASDHQWIHHGTDNFAPQFYR